MGPRLTRPATHQSRRAWTGPNADAALGHRALGLLPGLSAAAIGVGILVQHQTPLHSIALYAVAFAWQIVIPGTLLHRALRGPSPQLLVELGMGSVVGLMFQFVGWFVLVGLGVGPAMVLWPLVVVAPFALTPRLRRHLHLHAYPEHPHPLTSWGLAATFILAATWFSTLFERTALPPAANDWYQDLYYHLSLSAMFLHQVTPMTPQVAGEPLMYHWFGNAHMAAGALASVQEMPVILNRLFILPIVAVTIAMFAALLHELTGVIWPAVIAGMLTVLGGGIRLATWYGLHGTEPLAINSPSQNYSLPIFLLALVLLVRLLRRGGLRRPEWLLLMASLMLASGAKSSSLPLLIGGMGLALVVAVLRRESRRAALAGLGAGLAALAVTIPFLGGGAGSGIQLFSSLRRNSLWASYVGLTPAEQLFPTGPVLPGLDRAGAWVLLGLIALAYAVQYAWLAPAAWVLRGSDQLAAAFLLGVGLAGWAAMMLIDHDGLSQVYFMNQALVAWHALAGWGVWAVLGSARAHLTRDAAVTVGIGSFLLGGMAALALRSFGPDAPEPSVYLVTMAVPVVLTATAAAGLLTVGIVARRRGHRAAAGAVGVVLSLGLLGAALLPQVDSRTHRAPAQALSERAVTTEEAAAALWLRANSSPGEIVATNVHCLGLEQSEHCDARSFWVSGLTERPVLLEGWGYTDAAHLAHGRDGLRYANQPFVDRDLYALNAAAFTEPSQAVLDELAGRGVQWLFADARRGQVSPDIGRFADEVWRSDDVSIYRVRQTS